MIWSVQLVHFVADSLAENQRNTGLVLVGIQEVVEKAVGRAQAIVDFSSVWSAKETERPLLHPLKHSCIS